MEIIGSKRDYRVSTDVIRLKCGRFLPSRVSPSPRHNSQTREMSEPSFVPGIDVRSAEAGYVRLVTPYGQMKINKGFMEQMALSVAVIVLTVMLWRFSARVNATLKKKTLSKESSKEEEKKEEEEEEEKEEEEEVSGPDEKRIKKGENSYFYVHKHLEAKDDKTTVSSYGWSDSKKTIRQVLDHAVVVGSYGMSVCSVPDNFWAVVVDAAFT